jgi:23S rRNA pseudouridine2605 synthase
LALVRVYAVHKPRGVICSRVAEGNTTTVFELLPEPFRGWFAVGRLDKDSEGLLLFANDSGLAQRLMDPGGAAKTYVVTVQGLPSEMALESIRRGGLVIDGKAVGSAEVRRLGKAPRGGTHLEVVLHEGRNRQIRRSFAAVGFKVRRLVRVGIGPVVLGALPAGQGRELAPAEVDAMLCCLNPR